MPSENLHEPLLGWFNTHRRRLPWRETRDPYAIWVSEVMLQQTQVATVVPYWQRWMARFPTVEVLATADEQEVLSLWQGLGYYRRGRMLLAGARHVAAKGLPRSAVEWLRVPGVGRYTAGAIASIALKEAAPLVDGNVERVFARLTGIEENGSALSRAAWRWASLALHPQSPGDWNQALMELGALVCRPLSPLCSECPLSKRCVAFAEGRQDALPVKKTPRQPVDLAFSVLVPLSKNGRYGVRQIQTGDWWAGMWEFPRSRLSSDLPHARETVSLGELRHQVTHHRIRLSVEMATGVEEWPAFDWLLPAEMEKLPMPAPQRKIYNLARRPRLL